jgi:hypothetical protein
MSNLRFAQQNADATSSTVKQCWIDLSALERRRASSHFLERSPTFHDRDDDDLSYAETVEAAWLTR